MSAEDRSRPAAPDEGAASPREQVTTLTHAWEQSAFWYLAGMEDGIRSRGRRSAPFPHGPTTPEGREFIRTYVDACRHEHENLGGMWPYLPEIYREWAAR